jgi:hypothetical protein
MNLGENGLLPQVAVTGMTIVLVGMNAFGGFDAW